MKRLFSAITNNDRIGLFFLYAIGAIVVILQMRSIF